MRAVGVRELKTHLSRFLREVAAGETVLVTDRGRVVAEIRPPGTAAEPESEIEARLRRMAEKHGGLVLGEPNDPGAYRPSPLRSPAGTGRRLLDEEREDR